MRPRSLVLRSLGYYWRTNLAVVLGVATAVAVLAGALLVGDSVRGSLRDLVLQRLGRTDRVVLTPGFFREALADDVQSDPGFQQSGSTVAPLIVIPGAVTDQDSGAPRLARAGLRRGRSVLALPRRGWRARSRRARRAAQPGACRRHRRRAGRTRCWCASSGHRRFPSNRCTGAKRIWAARCA